MPIINKTRNTVLATDSAVADTFLKRAKGLLGRKALKQGEALIISPCDSIHTFFMRFAIDCLFLDRNNVVVKALTRVRPFRLTPIYWRSKKVIELPAGIIESSHTSVGDTITIE